MPKYLFLQDFTFSVELLSPDVAVILRTDRSFPLIYFFFSPTKSCASACGAQTAVALQIFRIRAFFFFYQPLLKRQLVFSLTVKMGVS